MEITTILTVRSVNLQLPHNAKEAISQTWLLTSIPQNESQCVLTDEMILPYKA